MSEPSQEPGRISRMRTGASRWRNTRRGTKTLKAAYAQAARDVKRMDPAVRERIGRANMTKADLQMLAENQVSRSFRPDRYAEVGQALDSEATARVQEAGTSAAPTRNPIRGIANRISRWQNTRQGTKALKAAYNQAARDVKRMDPSVREAIGRSGVTKSDLQALSQGRMDQVFRPEGRFGAVPEQQGQPQQSGQQTAQPGQQQMVQPQQQMPQQVMQPGQDRTMQLLAEYNQLQAQAAQLLQTRIAQLQAETAQLSAMLEAQAAQQAQVAQMLQPEAGQQQQPEPAPQPEAEQPVAQQSGGEQAEGEQAQPVAENADHVGKHQVVQTNQEVVAGPDPADPKNWVDVAAGNAPVQPLPQEGNQQEGLNEGPEAQESATGEAPAVNGQSELSPADMQNMHAAYSGMAPVRTSTGEQARDTAAESEDTGKHHASGLGTAKNNESKIQR